MLAVWIIGGIALYVIAGAAIERPLAGHFAWKNVENTTTTQPNNGNWADAHFAAVWLAMVWPVTLVGLIGLGVGNRLPAIGAEADMIKADKAIAEKKRIERDRARLAQLEADLLKP